MTVQQEGLKVLLWGFGFMNKRILQYSQEYNHKIVGVIGHHDIGKDSGEAAGVGPNKVSISSEAEATKIIENLKPDICALSTRSTLAEVAPTLRILGGLGVNTITIAEELFYGWSTAPELTKEMDELYKKNNATLIGSGFQDVFWGYLPAGAVGGVHKVERVEGLLRFNCDEYGATVCNAHGLGLSKEEFAKQFTDNPNCPPCFVWNSNEWLCSCLGWKVKSTKQVLVPTLAEKDTYSVALKSVIPAGHAIAQKSIAITETEHGVIIETTMIAEIYPEGMEDKCEWRVKGAFEAVVNIPKPPTAGSTCAVVVNRLRQVVSAQPGYVTSDKLGLIR